MTRRIMVVDDDADFVDSAAYLLEDRGFEVLAATSGREAAGLLRSADAPSLILLDLRMPEMSGRDLLEEKQRIPCAAEIPVIILSGSEAGDVERELVRFGVVGRLRKPVEPEQLVSAIERNLLQTDTPTPTGQLRKRIRARDELLAVVAHDLRVPVGAISLAASRLLSGERLEETDRSGVEIILRSAHRLERLIRDLVDVANIESGKLQIEVSAQPIAGILEDAADALRARAGERGVEIRVTGGDADAEALCDRDRVLQAVSNLVDNAVKFTPAGGEVSLGYTSERDSVRVEVQDTGLGIAPEDQEHVFQPYWQRRDLAEVRSGGVGLGLYITRGLILAQGGKTGVDSEPGRGSTFWFSLPRLRRD